MMTQYKNAYVVNVMSSDHPGIVAAVGGAISGMGGNIDSCSQTVLGGYFTLIMIVSLPNEIDPSRLAEEIRRGRGVDLEVVARPFKPIEPCVNCNDRFVITAFGKDRPGIVLQFSQYLAGKDINIVDLFGDHKGDDFVLISEVDIPKKWEISLLQADLEEMGKELGFAVRLQHENIFVATNQLRLTRESGSR